MSQGQEIKRHRLLARRCVSYDDGRIVFECGHSAPLDQARTWATRMTQRIRSLQPDPTWYWSGAYVYCQICAESPHSITNPEAFAKLADNIRSRRKGRTEVAA